MSSGPVGAGELDQGSNASQRAKWYTTAWIAAITLPVMAVMVFNARVDPLWMLPSALSADYRHCVRDERQNKINHMIYRRQIGDAVLLGSSRAAYLDPIAISPGTFNYAVNGMRPIEYAAYMRHYVSEHGAPKTLYVGLDEFGLMSAKNDQNWIKQAEEKYASARSLDYRLNQLISPSVLKYAWETITACQAPERAKLMRYTSAGLREQVHVDEQTVAVRRNSHITWYKDFYRTAQVDPDFREKIDRLRSVLPGTSIVPYISPVRRELLEHWALAGRLKDMKAWLSDIISTYGMVYNFMVPSAFSMSDVFFDAHHIYPKASGSIGDVLAGRTFPVFGEIGSRVDASNLDAHMEDIRVSLCQLIPPARRAPSKLDCTGLDLPVDPDATVRESRSPFALTLAPANWSVGTANSTITPASDRLLIDSRTRTNEYILLTTPVPLRHETTYTVNYDLTGTDGTLSVAVLSNSTFTKIEAAAAGKGRFKFENNADTAQIVLFNNGKTPAAIVVKSLELSW